MLSVSSTFQYNSALKNAAWKRRLLIGTSDYTGFVTKWPSISKVWDTLNPGTITIELSNENRTFNFFSDEPTKMQNIAQVQLGFMYVGSEEFVTMFSGTVDGARYQNGGLSLTLIDKFKILANSKIGDTTSPVNHSNSSYLVHSMAWMICTSYGGLNATTDASNPDIDWGSFSSWSALFLADSVKCSAYLTGQQPLELLRKLSSLTQSAIFIENNKIKFTRFSQVGSVCGTLSPSNIRDTQATLDDRQLVNKSWVSGAYNVTSKSFGITVFNQNSGSIAAYGLREALIAEQSLWLTDSVSTLNLAQRNITTKSSVKPRYQINATLQFLLQTIGDAVQFQDPLLQVDNSFRIMSETVDLETGGKTITIDQSQYFNTFMLDYSSLDSSDILT